MREALRALRAEDMVRLEPRRGYIVSMLSRQDLEEIGMWSDPIHDS